MFHISNKDVLIAAFRAVSTKLSSANGHRGYPASSIARSQLFCDSINYHLKQDRIDMVLFTIRNAYSSMEGLTANVMQLAYTELGITTRDEFDALLHATHGEPNGS